MTIDCPQHGKQEAIEGWANGHETSFCKACLDDNYKRNAQLHKQIMQDPEVLKALAEADIRHSLNFYDETRKPERQKY